MPAAEVEDSEHALRSVAPVPEQWHVRQNRPTSAVFKDGEGASVWIRERLPGDPDRLLHRPPKHRHGRIALPVSALRTMRRADGTSFGIDVLADPDGAAPRAVIEYVLLHRDETIERMPQL